MITSGLSLVSVPSGGPLFVGPGGKTPSRRHAFLHKRFGGDVKQDDDKGETLKRKGGNTPKRESASAGKCNYLKAEKRFHTSATFRRHADDAKR